MRERWSGWAASGLGALMVAVGLLAAVVGPVEVDVFRVFSEGGRHHYEGFRFGSLMFAIIAAQVAGYYLTALLAIPVGVGHLRRRRWARAVMEPLLRLWLLIGLPVTLVAFVLLVDSKQPSAAGLVAVVALMGLIYPVAPFLLIRFYRSPSVIDAFRRFEPDDPWLERVPMRSRILAGALAAMILALQGLLLLNAPFPLGSALLSGSAGSAAIGVISLALVGCTWGLLRGWRPAAWLAGALVAILLVSTVMALQSTSLLNVLQIMEFPPYEMELFGKVPLLPWPAAPFAAAPLVGMLVLCVAALMHGPEQ